MNQLEPPVQACLDASFKVEKAAARPAVRVPSSSDASLSKTLGGTITSWNMAAEDFLGYETAERTCKSIRRLIPEHRNGQYRQSLARIPAGGQLENHETVRSREDGKLIGIPVIISPVRNQSSIVTGASKIIRDISERKRSAFLGGKARPDSHSLGVGWHLSCPACDALAANGVAGQEPEA